MDLKTLILTGTLIATSVVGQITKKLDYDPSLQNFSIVNEQTSNLARASYSTEDNRGFLKFENKEGEIPFGMNYLDTYDPTSQTKRIGISNENLGIEMNECETTGTVQRAFGYYVAGKYEGLELKTSVLPSGELAYSTAYLLTEREKISAIVQTENDGSLEEGLGFKTEDRGPLKNLEVQVLQTPFEKNQQSYAVSAKTTISDDKNVLPSVGLEYIAGPEWEDAACSFKYKNLGLETKFGENKVEEQTRNSVSVSASFFQDCLQLRTIYKTDELGKEEILNFIQYKKDF